MNVVLSIVRLFSAPNDRKSSWNSNRSSDESLERTRAANNIGKFFQSSAAPRYGEPTFAKVLKLVKFRAIQYYFVTQCSIYCVALS